MRFIRPATPPRCPKGSSSAVCGRWRSASLRWWNAITPASQARKKDGLLAFNLAFAQDGFFVYVPDGVVLDKPIQIVNIMRSDVDFMANSHNVVVLGRGAKAQVLVCDHAADEVRFLANRVTEVFVGEQACYEHYKLESTHDRNTNLSALLVEQQEGSNVLANIMTLHSGMTRNLVEIALEGEHCETLLCGMALCDQAQRVDNFTSILHNKPNCHSNSLFKYILDDTSLGGFTGRLVVAQDAQKTQAYQSNKNLLLNHDARMRTKPQLEIYADDVKCSHGATIGRWTKKPSSTSARGAFPGRKPACCSCSPSRRTSSATSTSAPCRNASACWWKNASATATRSAMDARYVNRVSS